MLKKIYKSTFLILAVSLMTQSLQAIEGLWHPMQLNTGWQQWVKHHPNKSTLEQIEKAKHALVRISPGCSGFFASGQGHVITSYSCVIKSLEEFSFLGSMNPSKEFSSTSFETAPLLSPANMIFQQVDSNDISAKISPLLNKTLPAKRKDKLKEIIKALEKDCQAKHPNYQKCRVQTVNSGTQYLMIVENQLQAKLIFAPPLSLAVQARYIGLGTNGLNEIELPVLLQVLDPKSSEQVPYVSKSYLPLKPAKISEKDPVFTVSYSDIYKRYLNRQGVEINIIPSLESFDHFENFAKTRQERWDQYYQQHPEKKYQNLYDYLGGAQWNYRLHFHGVKPSATATAFLKKDLEFRSSFDEFFKKNATAAEQQLYYKALAQPETDYVPFTASLIQYSLKTCNPSSVIKAFTDGPSKDELGELIRKHELGIRGQMINPEVAAICVDAALSGFSISPKLSEGLDPTIIKLLNMKEGERVAKLKSMIKSSVIVSPDLDKKKYDPKVQDDDFLKLYFTIDDHINDLVESLGVLDFHDGPSYLIYGRYLEKYFLSRGEFYFPGMGREKLQVYGFGHIKNVRKDKKGHIERFASSIDSGFRNMKGAPTFNDRGDLVGMFWSTDYERRPYLNFYYDYDEAFGIHATSDTIIRTFKSSQMTEENIKALGI